LIASDGRPKISIVKLPYTRAIQRDINNPLWRGVPIMKFDPLEALLPQRTKFDLIVHDWGCVLGLMFQNKHPDLVDKIVAINVGIMDGPIKLSDVLVCYQLRNITDIRYYHRRLCV
jgi:hypothetical protein